MVCTLKSLVEEENQKLKEMINSLGAGRVDARTFEDLGRKQREIAEAEAALKELALGSYERHVRERWRDEARSNIYCIYTKTRTILI